MAAPRGFREAMSRFPAGVTIVTTRDASASDWGVTVTAFTAVSGDPPLVAVCFHRDAGSTPAFAGSERFAVSILRPEHEDLAARFATGRPDKFILGGFTRGYAGLPVVGDALALLGCRTTEALERGDHVMVLGEVEEAEARRGPALAWFDRDWVAVDLPI